MRGEDPLLPPRDVGEEDLQLVLESLVDEWDDRDFPHLPPKPANQLRRILGVDA